MTRRLVPALFGASLLAAAAGCHGVPLVAPSGTKITLVPGTKVLAVNGIADITAVLIEGSASSSSSTTAATTTEGGGAPVHDGTVVTFTTTLGRLEPSEARTNNGRVLVKLIADGRSGVATITAFSGAATATVDVNVGAAAATQLSVTASPQSLPGTGGSSTISAKVEDQQGNGLTGIPVNFTTTKGNLSPTSALTNDQGVAVTTLTTTEAADVTALTGGGTAALSGKVSVTLKARTTVSISSTATSAIVGVPVPFTITPGTGAIITNVVVDFGDGSNASLGAITAATPISHPFRSQGIQTVKATATDSDGGTGIASTQIAVSPLVVTINLSPSTPTPGVPVTLTANTSTGALIDKYDWDFGDTTFATVTSPTTTHTFNQGRYVITLKVTPFGNGTPVTVVTFVDVK